MKILVINGPNLNILGKRDKSVYGDKTLEEINNELHKIAENSGIDILSFQSNSEGTLIDFIQENSGNAEGIVINPGALSHYSYALRDALVDSRLPIMEVHISNICAREDWRSVSVIAPIAKGSIRGIGWQGYITALNALVWELKGKSWE